MKTLQECKTALTFVFFSFSFFVFLSRHNSDQMSEGSQVSKVAVCVQILKIPIKFLQVKIATVKKCMAFCPIWLCLQEICHMYLLPPMHLPLNCEKKVKVFHATLNNWNYWRLKVNDKFDSVWSNQLGNYTVAMELNLEKYDFGLKDVNVTILKKTTGNVIKSNKCNQCDYSSMHSGEKLNKFY